jgi:hypothetical protein
MAYFNHAFNKVFVGTSGFVTDPGTKSIEITKGQFTFVDPTTWKVPADLDPSTTLACPLVLASGSIYAKDKIGKFHGGYQESVKSKIINPKYVTKFYRVDPCTPQQAQIYVGLNADNFADPGTCAKDFLCGETYYLRMDIKGSPVLRFLSRNTYFTADAYTGCCAADSLTPEPVNPLLVYAQWAFNFLNSPLIAPFINIQITYSTDAGTTWLQLAAATDGTTDLETLRGYVLGTTALPAAGTPSETLAGLIINGAYVDTRFGDCTFYPNDSIIAYVEPVKIYASEVDYNGDPCAFTGLCVNDNCAPIQGSGFGESVVRELILSEGYNQSPFYTGTDLRIREITQGYDVTDTINRDSSYTRYFIQHSVPRFNNPSGTFDNDQYLLEIITESSTVAGLDSTAASTSTAAAGDLPAYGTVTVASTAGLEPGMVVTKTSGTGTIVAGAYILEVVSSTVFRITLGTAVAPITVALDGTTVLSATSAVLSAFENFVNSWIANAQGATCVQLETFTCPSACTPIDPTN